MTRPGLRRSMPHRFVALSLCTVTLVSTFMSAPLSAIADTTGGQASSYTVPARDENSCTLFSPLFTNNVGGRTSTLVLSHEATNSTTATVRLRRLGGGTLVTRNITLAGRQLLNLSPSDLSVPADFSGSLEVTVGGAASDLTLPSALSGSLEYVMAGGLTPSPTGTPAPTGTPTVTPTVTVTVTPTPTPPACGLSGLVFHDSTNGDRTTVEAVRQIDTRSDLFVPAVHKNDNGMNTDVVIQNTDRNRSQTVILTFRSDTGPVSPDRAVTIPADSALSIDMTVVPDGVGTLEIDGPPEARLVATAYHSGTGGIAAGVNASGTGADRISLPLLFRKAGSENGYTSFVRVMKVRPGAVTPRITLWDRDTGTLIGPIVAKRPDGADVVLGEDQGFTWDLSQLRELADGKIYAAEVDSTDRGEIVALAAHLNMGRGTLSAYAGVRQSVTDRVLSAPFVVKNQDGLNAGIQIRNLGGNDASVTIRFFNPGGNRVGGTESLTVPSRESVTVYLAALADLPDGTYTAEITSSAPVNAVVNLVRYR